MMIVKVALYLLNTVRAIAHKLKNRLFTQHLDFPVKFSF